MLGAEACSWTWESQERRLPWFLRAGCEGLEREALSVVLILGWGRAVRGCSGVCGDLVIESFRKIPCGCREERLLTSKAGQEVRVQDGGDWEPCRSGGQPLGRPTEHRLPCCPATCPYLLCEWLRWSWGPRSHTSYAGKLSGVVFAPAQSSGLRRCMRHDSCPSGGLSLVVGRGQL